MADDRRSDGRRRSLSSSGSPLLAQPGILTAKMAQFLPLIAREPLAPALVDLRLQHPAGHDSGATASSFRHSPIRSPAHPVQPHRHRYPEWARLSPASGSSRTLASVGSHKAISGRRRKRFGHFHLEASGNQLNAISPKRRMVLHSEAPVILRRFSVGRRARGSTARTPTRGLRPHEASLVSKNRVERDGLQPNSGAEPGKFGRST
jgi:hypothetical protein